MWGTWWSDYHNSVIFAKKRHSEFGMLKLLGIYKRSKYPTGCVIILYFIQGMNEKKDMESGKKLKAPMNGK